MRRVATAMVTPFGRRCLSYLGSMDRTMSIRHAIVLYENRVSVVLLVYGLWNNMVGSYEPDHQDPGEDPGHFI